MTSRLFRASLLIVLIAGIIHPVFCQDKSIDTIEINWKGSKVKVNLAPFPDRNPERFEVLVKALKKAELEKIIVVKKSDDGKADKTITFDNKSNAAIFNNVKGIGNDISFNIHEMLEALTTKCDSAIREEILDETKKVKIEVRIQSTAKSGSKTFISYIDLEAAKDTDTSKNENTLNQLAFPVFSSNNEDIWNFSRRNRLLFIDASRKPNYNMGTVLHKRNLETNTCKPFNELFDEVKSLDSRGNLKVLMRAYNFSGVEQLKISVNGESYSYEQDLTAFSSQFSLPKNLSETSDGDKATTNSDEEKQIMDKYYPYLYEAFESLSKSKYLNIEDINVLNSYKKNLRGFMNSLTDTLGPASMLKLSEILSWYPEYVFLNSIAIGIPDDDEVAIAMQLTKEGNKTVDYQLGTYKTKGGMGFNFGSMFYVTGLSINDVYTKQVSVNDSTKELRAVMDSTNKVSVGIGMNAEIYFRTGSLVKPTINIGFFVPLGQELVPYLAVGPGLVIGNKKVKFSLNGGFAFGQVNTIADRYKDVDVSGVEDITSITKKVWKPSWYVGIGVSFNVTK